MNAFSAVVKRNTKLFFKDKGMFFTSLITPIILLVLYVTFLANVYRDSFLSGIPKGVEVQETLIDSFVGAQLFSSLLAVCCITVAFCSNMLMVTDKISGARFDLTISPVKKSTLALGYYISTLLSTLIICYIAVGACFIYLGKVGWYLSASDVTYILIDIFLLVMFGTALSSCVNVFLSSQGQVSAVGTIVSAGYGFICGAYMPISQFGEGLQKVLSFLPGTYGTSLLKNHCMNGVFREMERVDLPSQYIHGMREAIDCRIEFFGSEVSTGAMFAVLGGSILALVGLYILINVLRKTDRK